MFEFKRKIYGYECDVYGHLNNSNYLQLLEAGRAEALIEMGIPVAKLLEMDISIFVSNIDISYIKPLKMEEVAKVKTKTVKITKVKGLWLQEIYNEANELCTKAVVTGVFTTKGKPVRISNELIQLMLNFLEG
ncbi:acyl-CoA thioesterase [bacterium]|nr:acyl-CoA thioesterase [bacterium]